MAQIILSVPIDTIFIASAMVLFELYVLFIRRQDIKKWVTRIARLILLYLIQYRDRKRADRRDCKRGGEKSF